MEKGLKDRVIFKTSLSCNINILIHLVLSVCLFVTWRSAVEPAIGKSIVIWNP
jgi:hypothetical protein